MSNKLATISLTLAVLAVASCVTVVVHASSVAGEQQAVIDEQAAEIVALEDTALVINDRLGVCLGSFARNQDYAAENRDMMQGISDKWGVNYRVPVKDAFTAFDNMAKQLECV